MKNIIFALMCIINTSLLFAQPTLDPAATVNPGTGEMSFALPLGSVPMTNGQAFPINLYYKAGIRLHDEASPVGLGFACGAGVISRKVIFVPDDAHGGSGYYYKSEESEVDETWWLKAFNWIWMSIAICAAIIIGILTYGSSLPAEVAGIVSICAALAGAAHSGIQSLVNYVVLSPSNYIAGGPHIPAYQGSSGQGFFRGATDDLPDDYFINSPYVNGEFHWIGDYQSGSFVFKTTNGSNEPGKQTVEMIKRTNANGYLQFEVRLADGTRLLFEKFDGIPHYEEVWQMFNDGNKDACTRAFSYTHEAVPVAWYLTKILPADYVDGGGDPNDPLDSEGENKGGWTALVYDSVAKNFMYQNINFSQVSPKAMMNSWCGRRSLPGRDPAVHSPMTPVKLCYLSTIKTAMGSASFNYLMNRKDNLWFDDENNGQVIPMPMLDNIQIKNHDGIMQRQVKFYTSYTLRPNSFNALMNTSKVAWDDVINWHRTLDVENITRVAGNPNSASLTLDSIAFYGINDARLPAIKFKYVDYLNPSAYSLEGNQILNRTLFDLDNGCDRHVYWAPYPRRIYPESKDMWGYYRYDPSHTNDFNVTGLWSKLYQYGYAIPYAAAWSLEKVTFPTGMSIQWSYESNRYDNANNVTVHSEGTNPRYGGGIRVSKVVADDGMGKSNSTQSLSYFYTKTDGDLSEGTSGCSGYVPYEPYNYLSESDYRTDYRTRGGLFTGAKVAYSKIQIVKNCKGIVGDNAPHGFTVHEFTSIDSFPNPGTYGEYDESWRRGYGKRTAVYGRNKKLVSSQEFEYVYQLSQKDRTSNYESFQRGAGAIRLKSTATITNGVRTIVESYCAQDLSGTSDAVQTSSNNVKAYAISYKSPNIPGERRSYAYVVATKLFGDRTKDDLLIITDDDWVFPSDAPYSNGQAAQVRIFKDLQIKNGIVDNSDGSNAFMLFRNYCNRGMGGHNFNMPIGIQIYDGDPTNDADPEIRISFYEANSPVCDTILNDVRILADRSISIESKTGVTPSAALPKLTYSCPYYCDNFYVTNDFGYNGAYLLQLKGVDVFDYNGEVNRAISINSDGIKRITDIIPALSKAEYQIMINKHILNASYQSATYTNSVDPANAIASGVTTWTNAEGSIWRHGATYAWNSDMDATGKAKSNLSTFSNWNQSADWRLSDSISRYDRYSHILEPAAERANSPKSLIYSTTVYGYGSLFPIATISNARFVQAGAYTGDYNQNVTTTGGTKYLDFDNGWIKGGAALTSGAAPEHHFGDVCVQLNNAEGVCRYFKIDISRDYYLTAWVKVPTGKLTAWVALYNLASGQSEEFPMVVQKLSDQYYSLATECTNTSYNQWKLLKINVPIKNNVNNNTTYAKVWFTTTGGGNAYLDDIRFYPVGSYVNTTYYSRIWKQPITTVDANNSPSLRCEFDSFGRQNKWYKYSKNNHESLLLVKQQDYHLKAEQ